MSATDASAPRRRRLPWGLLGMLALVWGIETWVARAPYTDEVGWSWRSVREVLDRDAAGCEVLGLGDSQLKFGLLPRVLEERLDGRVYNLAVVRAQPVVSAHLLRAVLAQGARPRAIVLNAFPPLLSAPASLNSAEWPELFGPRGVLELAAEAREPFLPLQVLGNWLLPTFVARAEIRGAILFALAGQPFETRMQREWRIRGPEHGGFRVPFLGNFSENAPASLPTIRSYRWSCRPEHEQAIRQLLSLAAAHEIRVFWLLMPVTPTSEARRAQNGLSAAEQAFLRRFQDEFPNLVVCDGRGLGLPKTDFYDPFHLNAAGAEKFSRAVAVALERHLRTAPASAARWVALTPDDVRPDALARHLPGAGSPHSTR